MLGLVLGFFLNLKCSLCRTALRPKSHAALSQQAQPFCLFCTRGWLHHYCRQNIVLLLWTELLEYLHSPPFSEVPASIKGMDKTPRRFFSKDQKMSVYQERWSFTKMSIWNGVVTALQVWKRRQKIGGLQLAHHTATQSNAIGEEGIPGACASISTNAAPKYQTRKAVDVPLNWRVACPQHK